jgi:hypothetical protein
MIRLVRRLQDGAMVDMPCLAWTDQRTNGIDVTVYLVIDPSVFARLWTDSPFFHSVVHIMNSLERPDQAGVQL